MCPHGAQETDNPDLRDRAYIYWRLLSTDPGALLGMPPAISSISHAVHVRCMARFPRSLSALSCTIYDMPAAGSI